MSGLILGEVDEIDRRFVGLHQLLQRHIDARLHIAELQRHRALIRCHDGRLCFRQLSESFFEESRATHRGRHEQETRLAHGEQRHLPGYAAFFVRVVVKLVHDDLAERSLRAISKGVVGENLRRAAKDRRLAIHRRIARGHADIVGTKVATQRQEFFIHQRLDRAGIDGSPPLRERAEMQRQCHQRLPRAGGRVEDHVAIIEQLQNGLFLRWVEFQLLLRHIIKKRRQQLVIGAVGGFWKSAQQLMVGHGGGRLRTGGGLRSDLRGGRRLWDHAPRCFRP